MPVGGAEDLVADIVRGLNPELFRTEAATIGPLGAVGEELAREGYAVTALGLNIKRTSLVRVVAAVRRLLVARRPDILHTHLYHASLYGRLAAWGLGLAGVVSSVHSVYTRIKRHRRLWNRLLVPVTDVVLAVSPQVRADILTYDGVPPDKVRLLPNAVDLKALEIPLTREEAKARLGVRGFCLGAVGRLEEAKGHAFLLEGMQMLAPELPELTLLVAGDGRLREVLHRQRAALGLEGRVHFLGFRRDVPLIYRALDLYVQPSLWEGLSLALLQAMGAGLPVVATRVSGFEEVITSGDNGILVPPRDAAALARAIRELYHDSMARRRLGEAARRTVAAGYSQELFLQRLETLYLELWRKQRPS